jgi:rhamnose transport system permease protein
VVIIALVGVIVVGSLAVDNVATPRFWRFLILDIIPIALIALPMTLVVITGEIDLSVASTLGVSCVVFGQLYVHGVTSLPLLIVLCLALGAVLGAFNGLFITVFGLPSLAVTIGTLAFFRGLAYVVIGDEFVATYPTGWTRGAIAPIPRTLIPWMTIGVLVAAALFAVVLHATPIGRGLYAIGNNADAARFAGVAVARTKFWLFVVSGAVAALAGVFYTLRFASARNDIGSGLELSVVAAVLLGGGLHLRREGRDRRRHRGRGPARHPAQPTPAGLCACQRHHDRHRRPAHRLGRGAQCDHHGARTPTPSARRDQRRTRGEHPLGGSPPLHRN